MSEQKEQLKCARCERESNEPAKKYDLRILSRPGKTGILCDKCAAADPKVVLLDNEVPKIEPAVPEETPLCEEEKPIETVEFGPGTPEPISIPTPKSALPAQPEPINTEGSIPRSEIVADLKRRQQDVAKLAESHQALLAQQSSTEAQQRSIAAKISDVFKLIAIQQGAVAQLKMTLGIKNKV